ncbi:MarR family transcriptional regulator [Lapillicoccus sp.]|uniref:MarR family transcriptional regulator n=1 Tax=Lapillicoccus sp. TaxID=1909287 RepID=UPI0025E8C86D|nr:MarR family transcriptional regulator [Lapillicoccus sp.]
MTEASADYRRYLASLVLFHLAAADAVGMGPTDYQASSLLDVEGAMTTGALAQRMGLTTSATTRLIDRLVDSGYVRRVADPDDRRRVLVEHTGHVPDRLAEILESVRVPIAEVVTGLSAPQQRGLATYFRAAGETYAASAQDLRARARAGSAAG